MVSILQPIMSSITVTATSTSSLLRTNFHPEIDLDDRYSYSCCLLDFYTFNSIPNIDESNNKFYYFTDILAPTQVIEIPKGSYELSDIGHYLKEELQKRGIKFRFEANAVTMRSFIQTDIIIDFSPPDSIGSVLGFSKKNIDCTKGRQSDKLVNIQGINSIRIDCDLTTGSYHNGKSTHTIYEFSPNVGSGYRILEQPKHLIYFPIVRHRISELNISILDQDGNLIDFRGEKITCRTHIKRDN